MQLGATEGPLGEVGERERWSPPVGLDEIEEAEERTSRPNPNP